MVDYPIVCVEFMNGMSNRRRLDQVLDSPPVKNKSSESKLSVHTH